MRLVQLWQFWLRWGIVPRLMAGVGLAIILGGGIQIYVNLVEDANEISTRHERELSEILEFLAPLVADQVMIGSYDTIDQLLRTQVRKKQDLALLSWTARGGGKMSAQDESTPALAPAWFSFIAPIATVEATQKIEVGGVGYGALYGRMTGVPSSNRLWAQFVKHLQVVSVTLLLMLQFMWLIFRGNLGTLRMLAVSANQFSRGDHSARIEPGGAPEVVAAAVAFNNMAANIESLIASLGESERVNRRLAAIVKQSSEAIWTRDLSGCITTWNAGASALFGYRAEEAVGRNVVLDARSSERDRQDRQARLEAGEQFSYETKAVTKAGREIDIEVAVAPLYDENNKVIGKISVAHDVTERKRAEQELNAAREAAEAANKAKSSFLARMSHEIRTPMNGVLGMTELLLETELSSTQRKFAETAQRSGKTLLGVINDILDFSKIEAGKLDLEHIDFDLRQAIEDTVELLAERAQSKGLELTCALPVDLVTRLKGDPLRLGQVLTNLIGNAIKFTNKGEVRLSVSCVQDARESALLRFEVLDTGPGIDKDAQERIFENFSQADGSTTRKHGGTGLGLPIARQLVEMMGGRMDVESTPGVGSTFWFVVPFEKQQSAPRTDDAYGNTLEGVRALVVAANATTRNTLNAQIGNWGMHNRSVPAAEQALDVLRQAAARGAPYDLVIIDYALGGSESMSLVRGIKAGERTNAARVVMLIPIGRHGEMREAREAGVGMCLSKPVRQSALYDALVSIMAAGTSVPAAPAANGAQPPSPPANRRRLLLAEDNAVNQQVAIGILKIEQHDVTLAGNGREALELYSRGQFDLVLMDCHMPEMDGFEATRRIRELEERTNAKRVPIIALTANAMQQDRDECLAAGMDDHLSKPYSRMQLRAVLDRWLSEGRAMAAQAEAPVAAQKREGPVKRTESALR